MNETLELIAIDTTQNAVQLFSGGLDAILAGIEAKVRGMKLDVSTVSGRDEIRSVAHNIARTKTALDAAGKKLTEDWRKQTAQVNLERKKCEERLDALKEEIRAPLTAFEAKERNRIAAHESAIAELSGLIVMLDKYPNMESKDIEQHLVEYADLHRGRDWEEFADRARGVRMEMSGRGTARFEARKKFETDQIELSRLRKEAEERAQAERDEKLKAEAAEKQRLESERFAKEAAETERKRVEAEANRVRMETERAARETQQKIDDAEAARKSVEQKAADERRAAEAREAKAAQDLRDAQEKARRDAEAAAQRERDKIEAERKAQASAIIKRESDKKLRAKLVAEIETDIRVVLSADPNHSDRSKNIAEALLANKIRHCKVIF